MGCGSSSIPDVEEQAPHEVSQNHLKPEPTLPQSSNNGANVVNSVSDHDQDSTAPSETRKNARVVGLITRDATRSKESSDNSLMYSSFGSKASVNTSPSLTNQEPDFHVDDVDSQAVVTGTLVSNNECDHKVCTGIAVRVDNADNADSNANDNEGIDDHEENFGTLSPNNLQQLRSRSNISLQDDLDLANSKANYNLGHIPNSDSSKASSHDYLSGFHNNDLHRDLLMKKNLSLNSTFSREDSGLSVSSLYLSEQSSRNSMESSLSGFNSSVSGASGLSPIVIKSIRMDEMLLESTQELHEYNSSDGEQSSVVDNDTYTHEVVKEDKEKKEEVEEEEGIPSSSEVDEWKDYLRKMSSSGTGPGDDEEEEYGSGTDSDSDSDRVGQGGQEQEEEEVEGYFRYVTAEGHEVWILLQQEEGGESRRQEEYTDELVNSMLGGERGAPSDANSFSPFHLSKEDALTNVTQVKEFRSKQQYEKALLSQQAEQTKKLQLIRQNTASMTTDKEGNAIEGMSVAERKKLLWNSSGKLETKTKI